MQKKLEEETATRRHEELIERNVRIREMTDVGGAVKAMQDLVFVVESTAMQRLEDFKWTELRTSCELWCEILRPLRSCRRARDAGRCSG